MATTTAEVFPIFPLPNLHSSSPPKFTPFSSQGETETTETEQTIQEPEIEVLILFNYWFVFLFRCFAFIILEAIQI